MQTIFYTLLEIFIEIEFLLGGIRKYESMISKETRVEEINFSF